MKSQAKRSLAKTLTWRILATTDTFLIAWLITGKLDWAGAIAGIEVATKMILYYAHERGWNWIKWGKEPGEESTHLYPHFDSKLYDSRPAHDNKEKNE